MRSRLPSCVTALGLLCGLLGIVFYPYLMGAVLLVLSLGLDAFDGWLARRLDAETISGAVFDSVVDCTLAPALLARVFFYAPLSPNTYVGLMATVVVGQIYARLQPGCPRFSGRTIATAVAVWTALQGAA